MRSRKSLPSGRACPIRRIRNRIARGNTFSRLTNPQEAPLLEKLRSLFQRTLDNARAQSQLRSGVGAAPGRVAMPAKLPNNLGAVGSPDAVKGYGGAPGSLPQYHALGFQVSAASL